MLPTGLLAALLLLAAGPLWAGDDGDHDGHQEGDRELTRGVVKQVQHVAVSGLDDSDFLILELKEGKSFQIPGTPTFSAGAGVRVEVEYLPIRSPGELPIACRVRVLAVPLERDGEEVLQQAANPFEVYADEHCRQPESANGKPESPSTRS